MLYSTILYRIVSAYTMLYHNIAYYISYSRCSAARRRRWRRSRAHTRSSSWRSTLYIYIYIYIMHLYICTFIHVYTSTNTQNGGRRRRAPSALHGRRRQQQQRVLPRQDAEDDGHGARPGHRPAAAADGRRDRRGRLDVAPEGLDGRLLLGGRVPVADGVPRRPVREVFQLPPRRRLSALLADAKVAGLGAAAEAVAPVGGVWNISSQ